MIKVIVFFVLALTSFRAAHAQIDWSAYSQSTLNGIVNKPASIGMIVCISKDNNSFWGNDENVRYFRQLLKDTTFLHEHSGNIIARTTFDTASVHFFMHGIDRHNADNYQFRIMEYPNRVVEPWQPIIRFTDPGSTKINGLPQMAYIGGYRARLSNMLVVDVRRIGDDHITSTAVVAWVPIVPIVTNIYTSDTFDAFLQRLQYPWSNQALKKTGMVTQDIKRSTANTNFIFFLKADIYHRKQVQYQLIRNGEITIPWKNNDYDNSFVWIKENRPGTYQVNIRYAVQPQHVAIYNFEVEPAWYQTAGFKILISILIVAIGGVIFFMIMLVRQRKMTSRESSYKTKLQLELKAIHAQLNPHFVFNALSSIQGLINSNDIRGANTYLADFARLMRESLKFGNKDEIPLQNEIEVLETYLKLEQLRFGFNYRIVIDEDFNSYEINMPSLLLQPLAENAVKHGIAGLRRDGRIGVNFSRKENALIIIIMDNGGGFDKESISTGYGLKLTRDRITLLNELNPFQTITLQIQSDTSGTLVTLTLKNWFL
ncbi:histidine kinase [Mucilaginibacter sp. MD40]|uniref:sensor histidine kinase n=1 Tax=Mucilaginibacter sp. MD40 TaxID=2029590 RepID=UPI000BACEA57|nr:histidine kinase [Mucilaginibacter sp. MD40]PAW92288.1 histidine kinase [Mucilaginibacter sp. MD40]